MSCLVLISKLYTPTVLKSELPALSNILYEYAMKAIPTSTITSSTSSKTTASTSSPASSTSNIFLTKTQAMSSVAYMSIYTITELSYDIIQNDISTELSLWQLFSSAILYKTTKELFSYSQQNTSNIDIVSILIIKN